MQIQVVNVNKNKEDVVMPVTMPTVVKTCLLIKILSSQHHLRSVKIVEKASKYGFPMKN